MANDDYIRLLSSMIGANTHAALADVTYALTSRMLASARSKTRFVTNSVNL